MRRVVKYGLGQEKKILEGGELDGPGWKISIGRYRHV